MANRKVSRRQLSEYNNLWPYVLAQAKHESANFTSHVYKANNNPWGMKEARIRPFLGTRGTLAPDGGYYAAYTNDAQAERDLVEWFRYNRIPISAVSLEDYVKLVTDAGYLGYNPTPTMVSNYVKGLKRFL